MTVKSLVLHLFPKQEAYNKQIISLVFSIRNANYGSSFFPWIYGPHASRLGHKSMGKNEDP